jgi:hypothetical protein
LSREIFNKVAEELKWRLKELVGLKVEDVLKKWENIEWCVKLCCVNGIVYIDGILWWNKETKKQCPKEVVSLTLQQCVPSL